MAGKSKKERKKRARTKKREQEQLNHKPEAVKKALVPKLKLPPETVEADMSGITTEGAPSEQPVYVATEKVNEDAQKDEQMLATAPDPLEEAVTKASENGEPGILPFDPKKLIADMLKKKDGV